MDVIIDGSYSLADTLSAIRYQERLGYALTALSQGPESVEASGARKLVNFATFMDLDVPGKQPKAIEMELVTEPPGVAGLIPGRLANGWALIVLSKIYVTGEIATVAVFRKL